MVVTQHCNVSSVTQIPPAHLSMLSHPDYMDMIILRAVIGRANLVLIGFAPNLSFGFCLMLDPVMHTDDG